MSTKNKISSNKSSSNNIKNTLNDFKKEEVLSFFAKLDKTDKVNSEVTSKPKTIDEASKKWDMNDKIVTLFKDNIEKDNKLKGKYAIILIFILVLQLTALNVWFFLKGRGYLNFSDSTFNIFVTGGIAEVFILVRVIVKYLFKDNLSDALNIILENANKYKRYNKKNKTTGNNEKNKE